MSTCTGRTWRVSGWPRATWFRITSRRGALVLPARASERVAPAQCFVAMHWGDEYLWGTDAAVGPGAPQRVAGVNALTSPAFCPQSKQPELKHAAVKLQKAALPWRVLAIAWLPSDQVLALRAPLAALMGELPFALGVPFGRERSGLLIRGAADEPMPNAWLTRLEQLVGLDAPGVMHYADGRRGQRRSMRLVPHADGGQRLEGLLLAGDTSAEAWIKTLLQDELPAQTYGRLLLQPGSQPPMAVVAKGRQVCSCFDVTEPQIDDALARCAAELDADARLARLQSTLRCGTNCGSCLPELRQLIRVKQGAVAA